MHSTVQTGLYTPNIFGFDYNFHHPSSNPHSNPYNHHPPPPHNFHHHHHLHQTIEPPIQFNKESSQEKQCIDQNTNNSNNSNNNNNKNNPSTCELCHPCARFKSNFIYFWQCSRPCGILSIVFGILCLITSILCFSLSFITQFCEQSPSCSESIVKLFAIMLLVISIVILFIGIVIIIYSKRDNDANVIITCSKHLNSHNIIDCTDHLHPHPHNSHKQLTGSQLLLHQTEATVQNELQQQPLLKSPSSTPQNLFLLNKADNPLHSSKLSINKNAKYIDSD